LSAGYLQDFQRQKGAAASGPLEISVFGKIAAGAPVETFSTQESLNFTELLSDKDLFALQVRGESMIEDHICDGDFVLIEKTTAVRNGDIVVALVKGAETTLKRFYQEGDDQARLQPANSAMQPILVPMSDLQIQGKLLAVLRKYKN
jgi:repressor LexA